MDWRATISPPDTPEPLFGAGYVDLVQLIITGRSFLDIENVLYHESDNGQEGLDTSFPYGWTSETSYPNFFSRDSPAFSVSQPLPGTEAYKANLTDQFEDYLLYQPPGSTQYVPLGHFVWTTDGHATEPLTNGGYDWSYWTSAQPVGTITPSGSATSFLSDNSFPMWTQNSGNDDGSYWTNL